MWKCHWECPTPGSFNSLESLVHTMVKASKSETGNYKPVSVISHSVKIFESGIQEQLISFPIVISNNFIFVDPSAFFETLQHSKMLV